MNNKTALVGVLAIVVIVVGAGLKDALFLEQLAVCVGGLIAIIWEYSGITASQSLWIAVSALCLWYWGSRK